MICLETDRQLGSFTTPQLLPSYHNHSQALPQTAGFRASEEVIFYWDQSDSSSGPKPLGALRAVSVCSRAHGSSLVHFSQSYLTNGHRSPFWENDGCSRHSFLPRAAGGRDWLWMPPLAASLWEVSVAYCEIPPFLHPWHWHSLAPWGSQGISIPFLVFHSVFALSAPLLWTECVLLKFICWHLNLQLGICRWGHWEVFRSWGWSPHEWD